MNGLQDVAAEWKSFGLQLGVKLATLDAIEGGRDKASNVFLKVLQAWLNNCDMPHTKVELVKIIRSPCIRNNRLACKIEKIQGELTFLMVHHFITVLLAEIPAQFNRNSVDLLHRELAKHLAAYYDRFGIQLGLEMAEIDAFAKNTASVTDHLRSTLVEWVKSDRPLNNVFEALESESVRERALAKELREKWSSYNSKLRMHLYSWRICFVSAAVEM